VAAKTRGRKQNRPAREQALLEAAVALFAARGFESTTTREIAAAAGCAEGLIHRYFGGKEGLLLAIVRYRVNREVSELSLKVPMAESVESEILQILDFELHRIWEDSEFFRVMIPHALVNSSYGQMLASVGPMQRAKVISERLRKFSECRSLPKAELESLANAIGVLAFTFGFMRPVIFGYDRDSTREMARTIAEFLGQGIAGRLNSGQTVDSTNLRLQTNFLSF
jgi:AcrR family transcriptional regulator